MPHIVVTDEQAKIIAESGERVEIRDNEGKHLGYVAHGFTDEDIAIAKQRFASSEPRYTTQQVLNISDRLNKNDALHGHLDRKRSG